MEIKEAKQILLESFNHSKDTREYFYLKKAKESGCPDHVFFKALMSAYDELEKYLNKKIYIGEGQYIENGTWEKMYEKNTIELSNGRLQWTLTDEDLPALLPALLSMGKTILSETVLNEYQKKIIPETSANPGTRTPAPKPKKQLNKTTYQWLTNPDKKLPELHKRMIEGKFIAEIDFPAFRAIFTGQPVESITTKLKWLKSKALLAYFINIIGNKADTNDRWSVAKYCIEDAGNLKQSYYNYDNSQTRKPKDCNLIDDLLKDL